MRSINGAWSLARKCVKKCLPLVRDPEQAVGTRAMLKPLLDRLTQWQSMMRAAMLAALLLLALAAARRPRADAGWFESGDIVLRNDLLLLNDAEIIRLPVNQWPMPRAAVRIRNRATPRHTSPPMPR